MALVAHRHVKLPASHNCVQTHFNDTHEVGKKQTFYLTPRMAFEVAAKQRRLDDETYFLRHARLIRAPTHTRAEVLIDRLRYVDARKIINFRLGSSTC